jgi:hypothetical protein
LKKTKRRRGISFSPHVEASTEERATGEAATTKIDAGGRNSRTAVVRSVGDVRDPTNLNRCTSKLPMRRRSGSGELGSVTDGEEARAVAMARRPALQAAAMACEGKGRRGSSGVCEGGAEVPRGRLYRLGSGGEGAPGGHGHAGLMGIQEGGFKEKKRLNDGRRVKRSFTTA